MRTAYFCSGCPHNTSTRTVFEPVSEYSTHGRALVFPQPERLRAPMLLSEHQRLQLAIPLVRPSIEAMIEAIRKQLDDVEAQMVEHVHAHYVQLDKLLRSASGIVPVASATLIAKLPELAKTLAQTRRSFQGSRRPHNH